MATKYSDNKLYVSGVVLFLALLLLGSFCLGLDKAYADTRLDSGSSNISIDKIDNQVVEVVTQAKRGKSSGAATENNSSNQYICDILNKGNGINGTKTDGYDVSDNTVPFGVETDVEGVYAFPEFNVNGQKRVYILYSYGACPTVTIRDGGYELIQGKDYALSYRNNKQLGQAEAVITGIGNYSGTISKSFDIIGYRLITCYTLNSNGKPYGWGGVRNYPSVDVDTHGNGEGDVTIIIKNNEGTYVAIGSQKGEYYPNAKTEDESYSMLMDVSLDGLHPQVDSSKNTASEYLWEEYEALTSPTERLFDTPVDTARLYMKTEYLTKFNIPSWECHNAHFLWTRSTPKDPESGWTLSNVVNSEQMDSYALDSTITALYGGKETLKNIAEQKINTSTIRLQNNSSAVKETGVSGLIQQALNIDETAIRKGISLDINPIQDTAVLGGTVEFAGFEVTLKDNGVIDMIKQTQDAGYLAKRMVSGDRIVDLSVRDNPVLLKFNASSGFPSSVVFAGAYNILPYDLTSGDSYDGGFFKEADRAIQNMVCAAANNSEGIDEDITKSIHGATITVGESNKIAYTGSSLALPITVKTELQDDVLSDANAKEGVDYEVSFAKYSADPNDDPTPINKEDIIDAGKYCITIKGLYPEADANKIGTEEQGTQLFCGEISQDFEVTANLMSAAVTLKMTGFEYDGEHAITVSDVLQEVKLNGTALQLDKDFTASLKGQTDNKEYASITTPGDYYLVITGMGNYTGEAKKSFKVTKASTDPQPSGLTVATSAHENGMVYLTGYRDGKQVELKGWTTTPQTIAIVTDTNKDGVLEVAFQAPGTVTITVQDASGDAARVVISSAIAPEGEDVETTTLVDDASGIEVAGVSKKSVDDDGMKLVVKSGNDVSKLSNVDTSVTGQRSLAMHDVSLYIGDTEVQPAGEITISFPVDVTEVPSGMKMIAYHWHGNAATPKEVVHEKIENGKALFTVRELSPFEVALLQDGGRDTDISHASIVGLKTTYLANSGQPLDLGVSLVLNGKTLVNGTDYDVQLQKLNDERTGYAPADNADKSGVYKLLFTGKGDYTSTLFSNPFNIVVDGDYTGTDPSLDNGQTSDPIQNNQNLGSNLDGSGNTGLADTGTKGSALAQTGDRQLVNMLALMAMICAAGGVSLLSKRRNRILK